MDTLLHFIEIFVICVGVLVTLAIVLFFIMRRLPNSPLKEILRAFSDRVTATAAVALVGLPLQPIPEVDGIYDIGGLIILGFYWYGIIAKIKSAKSISESRAHIVDNAPQILQLMRHLKRFRRRR